MVHTILHHHHHTRTHAHTTQHNALTHTHTNTWQASALVSFVVGTLCLLVIAPFNLGLTRGASDKPVLWWMWVVPAAIGEPHFLFFFSFFLFFSCIYFIPASFLFYSGVYFVSMGAWLQPHLGTAVFFICIVLGQLVQSLVIDHYGLLDLGTRTLDP